MLTEKLREIYDATGADALFLESDFLRRYLTGFYSTDGYVIVTEERCTYVVDSRYFDAARTKLRNTPVRVLPGGLKDAMRVAGPYHTLGVPYPFTSVAALRGYEKEGHETVDCMPALRRAMIKKDPYEISRIQTACEIAEKAFNELLGDIKEGMTERDIAGLLEYYMRAYGASGTSFDTICAIGAHGAIPHYETGERKLRFGDEVLIDFGCKYGGYCSDITRTFLFGDDKRHEDFKRLHGIVLFAHEYAKEHITAGMTGREADAVARNYLKSKGLDDKFTHSLGHGVGLCIHEAPYLSPRSEDVLEDGMVFSIEPGIYIPGETGIRIEDTVQMKDGRILSFMGETSRKALIIL